MNTKNKVQVGDRRPQTEGLDLPYPRSDPIPIPNQKREPRFCGYAVGRDRNHDRNKDSNLDDIGYIKTDFAFEDLSEDY